MMRATARSSGAARGAVAAQLVGVGGVGGDGGGVWAGGLLAQGGDAYVVGVGAGERRGVRRGGAAGDQGPAPAMLRARTWTWCAVLLASPAMVAVVPAAAVGTDHSPPEGRYRIW